MLYCAVLCCSLFASFPSRIHGCYINRLMRRSIGWRLGFLKTIGRSESSISFARCCALGLSDSILQAARSRGPDGEDSGCACRRRCALEGSEGQARRGHRAFQGELLHGALSHAVRWSSSRHATNLTKKLLYIVYCVLFSAARETKPGLKNSTTCLVASLMGNTQYSGVGIKRVL